MEIIEDGIATHFFYQFRWKFKQLSQIFYFPFYPSGLPHLCVRGQSVRRLCITQTVHVHTKWLYLILLPTMICHMTMRSLRHCMFRYFRIASLTCDHQARWPFIYLLITSLTFSATTAILPIFFTTYFRQVQAGPVTNFPMPPVSPPQPLPRPLSPNASGLDIYSSTLFGGSSPPHTRPVSMSFSSTISPISNLPSSTLPSMSNPEEIAYCKTCSTESHGAYTSSERALSTPNDISFPTKGQGLPPKRLLVYSSTTENPSIGPEDKIVPEHLLNQLSERSLAMHLFRSFQNVMSTQESMWEELKDWVRNKTSTLKELGWEDDEDLEEHSIRRKFEKLLEKYQG